MSAPSVLLPKSTVCADGQEEIQATMVLGMKTKSAPLVTCLGSFAPQRVSACKL